MSKQAISVQVPLDVFKRWCLEHAFPEATHESTLTSMQALQGRYDLDGKPLADLLSVGFDVIAKPVTS